MRIVNTDIYVYLSMCLFVSLKGEANSRHKGGQVRNNFRSKKEGGWRYREGKNKQYYNTIPMATLGNGKNWHKKT